MSKTNEQLITDAIKTIQDAQRAVLIVESNICHCEDPVIVRASQNGQYCQCGGLI